MIVEYSPTDRAIIEASRAAATVFRNDLPLWRSLSEPQRESIRRLEAVVAGATLAERSSKR